MAVPSAVLKQREKLEKELGINRDGSPIVTDPAASPVSLVPPVSDLAPQSLVEPVVSAAPDLQVRITELENLLKSRDAQTSIATREANDAKIRADTTGLQVKALEDAVAELTRQKETAEAQLAAKAADSDMPNLDEVGDLSPTELETFGADSVKFVEKLSKKELLRYIKPLISKIGLMETRLARLSDLDKLPQIEKVVNETQAESNRVKEAEFFRKEVLANFPDFETVREAQEWKDYLATDIPDRGIKLGHLLHQYRVMHNAPGIRSLLQGFYDAQKVKPTLASLAVPSKTSTEGTPVVKPKVKASEYQTKLRQFTSKKLDLKSWDAFKTEFDTAMQEGRVEMDVRL